MPAITASLIGRFGNQAMIYLWARGYAARHGFDFYCDPWVGSKIFELDDKPIPESARKLPGRSETRLEDGEGNIRLEGYGQNQACVTYTRKQAREWLNPYSLRPKLTNDELNTWLNPNFVMAHRRVGDYKDLGFQIISEQSYRDAAAMYFPDATLDWVTEEKPCISAVVSSDIAFFPDFLRLVRAERLLRGNSTFSWVAALIGFGEVYSPIISAPVTTREAHCQFVRGNWPRLNPISFVSDMHVPEQ